MLSSRNPALVFSILIMTSCVSRADFKYSESSKMTGGSLMTMTKTLGVFSKSARQINEPQLTTVMVKGNRMRSEQSDGMVEIIDLDGRRFVHIDPAHRAYSIVTFDDFKTAMQNAQERAKEEQAKAIEKHPEASNITITPKMHSEVTGATRTILDLPTKEMKWQIEMQIESTDPKVQEKAQSASMTMNSDAWIAPEVPGYDEVRQFYMRMAKQLDWLPNTMGKMMGMNPQMGPAMQEFQKNLATVKGMPLLQNVSFGMSAAGVPQDQTAASPQAPPPSDDQASVPTSARDAIGKGIGGVFGGFGRKKKKQNQDAQAQPDSTSPQSASASGSLMEMQVEVTQYSTKPLEKDLFDIPTGYTQVQQDPNQVFGGAPPRQ
ncbi:MAG: hypothetical protein ACRD2U_15545 [Terriglobales bacterium]